mgnify:CR=1 FL=1
MEIKNTAIFKRKVALIGAAFGLVLGLIEKEKSTFKTLAYVAFMYGAGNVVGDALTITKDIQNANGL